MQQTPTNLKLDDVKDVLLELHKEHYAQIRHYETQRSTVSNLLVIIAAALLAFITFDKSLAWSDLPLTGMVTLVGLFGAAFCLKFYERATVNSYRVRGYRARLDAELFSSCLVQPLIEEANEKQQEKFPNLYEGTLEWVKVHRLWMVFHLLISILGLVLTFLAIFYPQGPVTDSLQPK
jgi:hypothetical protein